MAHPHTGAVGRGGGKKPVDLNAMKRNMNIAKGFLDISLLSANANQLRNVINYGDRESTVFYLIMTGIIISLILQVSAGVILILSERFDINKEDEQDRGDLLNTVVTCLIFLVLIINVFVASLGVDIADFYQPTHPHHDLPGHTIYPTTPSVDLKNNYG